MTVRLLVVHATTVGKLSTRDERVTITTLQNYVQLQAQFSELTPLVHFWISLPQCAHRWHYFRITLSALKFEPYSHCTLQTFWTYHITTDLCLYSAISTPLVLTEHETNNVYGWPVTRSLIYTFTSLSQHAHSSSTTQATAGKRLQTTTAVPLPSTVCC